MHPFGLRTWSEGLPFLEYDLNRLEITRSAVFQELPKSRYVEGVSGQDFTQTLHHHDDEDEVQVQIPNASTNNANEPTDVDKIGTRPISPPSESNSMSPIPDIAVCPHPAF